eukprot:gene9227-9392_t
MFLRFSLMPQSTTGLSPASIAIFGAPDALHTVKQLVTSRADQQQVLQAVHAAGLEQHVLHGSTAEAQKDAAAANKQAVDEVLRQRTAELDRFRAEYDRLTAAKLSTEEQLLVKDAQVADLQQQRQCKVRLKDDSHAAIVAASWLSVYGSILSQLSLHLLGTSVPQRAAAAAKVALGLQAAAADTAPPSAGLYLQDADILKCDDLFGDYGMVNPLVLEAGDVLPASLISPAVAAVAQVVQQLTGLQQLAVHLGGYQADFEELSTASVQELVAAAAGLSQLKELTFVSEVFDHAAAKLLAESVSTCFTSLALDVGNLEDVNLCAICCGLTQLVELDIFGAHSQPRWQGLLPFMVKFMPNLKLLYASDDDLNASHREWLNLIHQRATGSWVQV